MISPYKKSFFYRFLDWLNELPVKYSKTVVRIALVVVLIASFGLFQLKIDTGMKSLINPDSPDLKQDKEIRKKFDYSDKFIVVIETTNPAGVFNYSALTILSIMSQDLKRIEEIKPDDVISLTTIQNHQNTVSLGDFPKAINFVPFTDSLYDLQKELYDIPIVRGTLVSADGGYGKNFASWKPTAFAIVVEAHENTDRNAVYLKIKTIIEKVEGGDVRIFIMGAPVAETELGISILKDLAGLIPFCLLVMALIFYFYYRSWRVVLIPLFEMAGCFIFVFGMIGYTGIPIYLPMTIMPVILISLGLPDVVHILNRYNHITTTHSNQSDYPVLVKQTIGGLYKRLMFTSLATMVGFSSFAFSGIESVRYFGFFTTLGLFFSMIWSLVVIPAQIMITKPMIERKFTLRKTFTGSIIKLSYFGLRNKWMVIAGSVLFIILTSYGSSKIIVQDSWESCFSKESSFSKNNHQTNKLFNGTHTMLVSFETDGLNRQKYQGVIPDSSKDFLLFPEVLKTEKKFESFLQSICSNEEGKISGFAEQLETMNFFLHHHQDSARHIGISREENEKILRYYQLIMGDNQVRERIDSSRQNCLNHFFIKEPDYKNVPVLIKKIRDYENAELRPEGIRIGIGGDVMQAQTMIGEIVNTQISSFTLALVQILVLLVICFRSFRLGLIGVIPPVVAILLLFAIMGYFSIYLGVATSMFASILVGLGVDFSIHLVESYKEYLRQSANKENAIKDSLTETGPAFLLDSLVLSFSFGLMFFSRVPSNTLLGLAIVIGYLACFVITMLLLPILLSFNKKEKGVIRELKNVS